MKVDKFDPTFREQSTVGASISTIPVRLEIATRVLAGSFAHGTEPLTCTQALEWADMLIDVHNKQFDESLTEGDKCE